MTIHDQYTILQFSHYDSSINFHLTSIHMGTTIQKAMDGAQCVPVDSRNFVENLSRTIL